MGTKEDLFINYECLILKSNKNFSVCVSIDADSTCPTELNPLSLEPPEIIAKYGESVDVNCTSTEDDHDGMHWTGDSEIEEDEYYIFKTLNMSDWKMTAQCRIKLTTGVTCSKDLQITIYSKYFK